MGTLGDGMAGREIQNTDKMNLKLVRLCGPQHIQNYKKVIVCKCSKTYFDAFGLFLLIKGM